MKGGDKIFDFPNYWTYSLTEQSTPWDDESRSAGHEIFFRL
jgi:hypothetical protein